EAAPGLERRLADRPPGRHRPRRHPLHAPDQRRRLALRPITQRPSRQPRRARTSRARRGRRRERIHLPDLNPDRDRRTRARVAEQRRLHQRRRPPTRPRHLRDLPRRMKPSRPTGGAMLILRQKMVAKPDKSDELMAALAEIITPARATEGVISLDIARVLLEPDSFIATAVYEDGAALERQESRPEVHKVVAMLPESLAAPLERTIFDASLDPALV